MPMGASSGEARRSPRAVPASVRTPPLQADVLLSVPASVRTHPLQATSDQPPEPIYSSDEEHSSFTTVDMYYRTLQANFAPPPTPIFKPYSAGRQLNSPRDRFALPQASIHRLYSAQGNRNIPDIVFEKILEGLRSTVPTRYGDSRGLPTIYEVPLELQRYCQDKSRPYDPVAVNIGAFWYHDDMGTWKLQRYKWWCVHQLISKDGVIQVQVLKRCLRILKSFERQIRASYFPDYRIQVHTSDALVFMMLLDGCFILHRLLKYARLADQRETHSGDGSDQLGLGDDDDWTLVFGRCWVWQLVTRDLLLLENQIPFFVLQILFHELKNNPDESENVLVRGCNQLFRSLHPQKLHKEPIECKDVHHLLHLFYLSVGFPDSDPRASFSGNGRHRSADLLLPELPQWIPCAKELEAAGVRFRKKKNAKSFLDINFIPAHGVLEIPALELYDTSDALFRNLIAFEQAYPYSRPDISAYAMFMDCLINTPEDMRIMHLRGILVNQMNGEQDASRFFSQICAQVYWSTDNYLVELMAEVNKYRESKRHTWRAALVRNHFSNPWVAMSVFAAVLLLSMTVLQTFFTVYPYFKPPSKE